MRKQDCLIEKKRKENVCVCGGEMRERLQLATINKYQQQSQKKQTKKLKARRGTFFYFRGRKG